MEFLVQGEVNTENKRLTDIPTTQIIWLHRESMKKIWMKLGSYYMMHADRLTTHR